MASPSAKASSNAAPAETDAKPAKETAKAAADTTVVDAGVATPDLRASVDQLTQTVNDLATLVVSSVKRTENVEDANAELRDELSKLIASMAPRDFPASIPNYPENRETFAKHPEMARYDDARLVAMPGEDVHIERGTRQIEVDPVGFKKKAERLRFDAELITFRINPVTDNIQDKRVPVALNGKQYLFERNRQYTVPRAVLGVLLNSQARHFGYKEEREPGSLINQSYYPSEAHLRYPVSIINDPSGMVPGSPGDRWYHEMLAAD